MKVFLISGWMFLLLAGCGAAVAVEPSATPAATSTAAVVVTRVPRTVLPAPSATPPVPTAPPTTPPTAPPAPPPTATPAPVQAEAAYSYPIGQAGQVPGDGFYMRHGYAVENTWFNPNHWHAGEDWYRIDGDTAGAEVYAVAAGEVVYVGANYPGRVVIVAHPDGLYSMYGHLDPAVAVQVGQQVARGQLLGTVLRRGDSVPNHLHFEVRTFYTTTEVNGAAPRYPFRCGVNCPPGPGYWPIADPNHPSDMGWRNATHVLNNRAVAPAAPSDQPTYRAVVVPAQPIRDRLPVLDAVPSAENPAPQQVAELMLTPGTRYTVLETRTGPEDSRETSALGYLLWYRVQLPDGSAGWVAALEPFSQDTGSDGRPSGIRFNLLPAP
ncbi:MAG: M23 family metallopeptidase [Chloroflexaceae bacterium]|nr:M23 family metallopeptidase [Chloroflexaceae bacterium]